MFSRIRREYVICLLWACGWAFQDLASFRFACTDGSDVSNSLRPYGLYPPPTPRLLYPWDSPGKNSRVGCHFLLQGVLFTQESNSHLYVSCTGRNSYHWYPTIHIDPRGIFLTETPLVVKIVSGGYLENVSHWPRIQFLGKSALRAALASLQLLNPR